MLLLSLKTRECTTLLIGHLLSTESLQREISRQMSITPLRAKACPHLQVLLSACPISSPGTEPAGPKVARRAAGGRACSLMGPEVGPPLALECLEEESLFSATGMQGPSLSGPRALFWPHLSLLSSLHLPCWGRSRSFCSECTLPAARHLDRHPLAGSTPGLPL